MNGLERFGMAIACKEAASLSTGDLGRAWVYRLRSGRLMASDVDPHFAAGEKVAEFFRGKMTYIRGNHG